MSAPTNQPTNNSNNADFPSAPPETHQGAGEITAAPSIHAIPDDLDVLVYFDAACTSEHLDGPMFARVRADAALLRRLLSLKEMRDVHDLRTVSASWQTDAWGPGDIEQRTRLISPRLVVDEDNFWFCEEMKHSSASFETGLENVGFFVAKVLQAGSGSALYFGSEDESLEQVREWQLEFGRDEPSCISV